MVNAVISRPTVNPPLRAPPGTTLHLQTFDLAAENARPLVICTLLCCRYFDINCTRHYCRQCQAEHPSVGLMRYSHSFGLAEETGTPHRSASPRQLECCGGRGRPVAIRARLSIFVIPFYPAEHTASMTSPEPCRAPPPSIHQRSKHRGRLHDKADSRGTPNNEGAG